MAEQQAKFTLTLEGKDDNLLSLFAAFKKSVRSDVSEIERITANVRLFGNLEADVKKTAQTVDTTRASLAALTRTINTLREAGEPIGADLTKAFNQAQRAAAAAEKSFIAQSEKLEGLRVSLQKAGVDVTNLAAAEEKLAVAAKAAAAAAQEQAQKQTLAFKTVKDIAPEIAKVNAAYTALATSGKLSFGELSGLHARATQQVAAIRSQVGGVGQAFRDVRTSLLGFAAAFAGVVAVSAKASGDFRAFTTQIAAIDTIADVSKGRIKELENGVRSLARTMGVDAVNSAQALYDIIGSGISADNALEVLSKSTQAARAGLTDVKTAASAGVAVLNAYGLQADELDKILDGMFQTVRDGVITFPELAQNIGNVLPIARAANVRFEELGASFATLTRLGINAPEAATAISRAIQELAAPAPEAADRMRELGIVFNGLVGTIEQFSKKNLSLDQIQKLIPEARAAKAVLGLAQNFRFLSEQVDLAAKSSGQMKAAYDRMADTPQARVDRFNAAMRDLSITTGQFVDRVATPFIEAMTGILRAFNNLPEKTQQTATAFLAFAAAMTAAGIAIKVLAVPINLVAAGFTTLNTAAAASATGLTAASVAANAFGAAVAGFVGFKIGEVLYEWSAAARVAGDVLGTLLASLDAVARFLLGTWDAATSLSKQKLVDTFEAFKRNAEIIRGDFIAAVTLSAEKSREAAKAHGELAVKLTDTAAAASKSAGEVGAAVGTLLSKLTAEAAAVEAALTSSQARLTALNATLKKGVDDIGASTAAQIGNLAAQVSEKLAALTSVDVKLVRQTVDIQKQAATDRLAILKKFSDDSLAAFSAEAVSRRAIAQKSQEDLKRVEQEIAQARAATLQDIVNKWRDHLDTLLQMQRAHLDRIRELEDQRRGVNQDAEEKIREIRRQSLDAYQQYGDRVNQIDEFISKSRRALAAGDNKLAEEFARKAIDAAGQVAGAVKDGEVEVVSASRAQSTAISAITQAQEILNKSIGQRVEAEKAGAKAAADGIREAQANLDVYQKALAAVQEQAARGVVVKAELDASAVERELDILLPKIAQREAVLKLKADLTEAAEAVAKAKSDIEKGKVNVPIAAKTEELDAAIQRVKEARPELIVETTKALAAVDDLRTKAAALGDLKPTIDATVNSNVADVQAQIDNLKKPTESTHTVNVVVNNPTGAPIPSGGGDAPAGFNRGGYVGRRRFARGGGVFVGGKVPGVGDHDTVPATLQDGQFVVRKAASRFYGDGLMAALARGVRRFAEGGAVKKAEAWANSGGTSDPPVNFDSRQIPEAFVTAANVISYAREMLNAVGAANPLLGSLKPAIENGINAVERNPGDKSALRQLLQAAETIGANFQIFNLWGKTASTGTLGLNPIWFVDWLAQRGYNVSDAKGGSFGLPNLNEYAKNFFRNAAAKAGPPTNILGGGSGSKNVTRRFSEGGGSTDTVPALLTPGEFVIRKSAVARFGARFMDAVNRMAIPRAAIANLVAPPPVARFATGGMVGGGTLAGGRVEAAAAVGAVQLTAVFNLDGSDLLSEAQVRRKVVPVLDDMLRRKGR